MMRETYYVGVYWGPRQETVEECARRAQVFLHGLSQIDPLFARWFKAAKTRKQSLKRPLELDLPVLQEHLRDNVPRDDTHRPMEDSGFFVGLWNGGRGADDFYTYFSCGAYWDRAVNRCVLNPPSTGTNPERLLTGTFLSKVLRCMALAWDPDWGVATSHAYRDLVEKDMHGDPGVAVGGVTYLSCRRGTVPPLPAPANFEHVEDKGTLITLTPERFTVSNPEHVALANRVRELLDHAGLLKER
jgi:hypothetical protein